MEHLADAHPARGSTQRRPFDSPTAHFSAARARAATSAAATVASLLALVLVLATMPTRSLASPRSSDEPGRAASARPSRSRSVGHASDGTLQHGVLLRESDVVRYVDEYRPAGRFYGTRELVELIERAATRVARRLPGARLSVGELSAERGGDVDGHSSHESGRDADLAFYMLDGRGRPYAPSAFAAFDARGRGIGVNRGLVFDDARNWELVARLVTDPDARVQFIFVSRAIERRLLAEGRRRGASERVLRRAKVAMVEPARGHRHRNHFHVRIYCGPHERPRCVDVAPFHPWYPGTRP